ncbi:MAG: triose-phosphate isomerase [bacterium]
MKKYLIAGNWKMNTVPDEAAVLASAIRKGLVGMDLSRVGVLLCPPAINLLRVIQITEDSNLKVGAQNCHYAKSGAFTGEISCEMIRKSGAEYVIIGHSERRCLFGETDEFINKKVHSAIAEGLKPILCVGETLEQRNEGSTLPIVMGQLEKGLAGLTAEQSGSIIIAYEPVWAIGTGLSATAEQAEEVHSQIRSAMRVIFGEKGNNMFILYGGSMNAQNAGELLSQPNISGGLIGGASLKFEEFLSIIKTASELTFK